MSSGRGSRGKTIRPDAVRAHLPIRPGVGARSGGGERDQRTSPFSGAEARPSGRGGSAVSLCFVLRHVRPMAMKLVATVKLLVSPEERERLLATMRRVNEACSWLAERAFELKSGRQDAACSKLHYREMRDRFGLSSQHTVRAISKVCEVYKRDRAKLARFTRARRHPLRSAPLLVQEWARPREPSRARRSHSSCLAPIGAYHRARLEGARGRPISSTARASSTSS